MIWQGEYWLDEHGQQTFADGDVGDVNHETVAYCAALGLPMPNDWDSSYDGPEFQIGERIFMYHPGDLGEDENGKNIPITEQNCLYLWVKNHGAPKSALRYFGQTNADARDYAVKYMNWIRVKVHSHDVEVDIAKLDQRTLDHLRRADFWGEEWTDAGVPTDSEGEDHYYGVYLNIVGGPRSVKKTTRHGGEFYTVGLDVLFGIQDAKVLLHQLRHPSPVVEAAAAEGEDPNANFSLKGLGSQEDREALSVYADALEERGDTTTAWRLRDPVPLNRQLPPALHSWQHWIRRVPDPTGRRGWGGISYFERVELDNGWGVSIQASDSHYSTPREDLPNAMDYTEFEVAVYRPVIKGQRRQRFNMAGTQFEETFRYDGVGPYMSVDQVTELLLLVASF